MVQNKARTKSQSRMEQEKLLKELEALKAKRQEDGDVKVTGLEMQQQLMDEARLQTAKSEQPKYQRTDARWKEIREELARRSRKKQEEDLVEEFYVDSYRMVSVQLSDTFTDLKDIIQKSGMKFAAGDFGHEKPEHTFAKTAHYFMSKFDYKNALFYVNLGMQINPESMKVRVQCARIHSLLGNWPLARNSAEWILKEDKTNAPAMLIKAEALFNCCFFEHALRYFHDGQRLAPDDDNFRLGIQKCHKTINDSLRSGKVFKKNGVDLLFKILRKTTELKSSGTAKYRYEGRNKDNQVGFHKVLNMLKEQGELGDDDDVFETKKAETEKYRALRGALKMGNTAVIKEDDLIEHATEAGLEDKLKEQEEAIELQIKLQQAKKFAHKKQQARETRVFAKKALKVARERTRDRTLNQKKQKVQDRLFEDKVYLAVLARGLNLKKTKGPAVAAQQGPGDQVEAKISHEAKLALGYLRAREDFWDQIEIGNDTSKPPRVCESFRFLM